MRIIQRNMLPANMQDTKTLQTWGQIVGTKPEYLAPVSLMKPEFSLLWHTKGLGNIHSDGKSFDGLKGATGIQSLMYEWNIKSTDKYVYEIAEDCTATGLNKTPFTITFSRKCYQEGDTFMLENRQKLMINAPVTRLANDKWQYTVTLVTNTYADRITDPNALKKGKLTQFISNYTHEADSKGRPTTNQQSFETHRNWVSAHRITETWTGDFLRQKQWFYENKKGSDKNGRPQMEYFTMMDSEKQATQDMLQIINNHLMFGETNMDAAGNCLDKADTELGAFDRIMGDGLISQVEKVCDKRGYSGKLTVRILREAISAIAERTGKYGGGMEITFFCNQRMWTDVQNLLLTEVKNASQVGTYFYAPDAKTKEMKRFDSESIGRAIGNPEVLKVGATFRTYNWAGYDIKFVVDASLSTMVGYRDRAYGIFLNTGLTDDGQANISLYTIKGAELIVGDLDGLGGQTGTASGKMSTPFSGARRDWKSYSSLRVAVPYHAFILEEVRRS